MSEGEGAGTREPASAQAGKAQAGKAQADKAQVDKAQVDKPECGPEGGGRAGWFWGEPSDGPPQGFRACRTPTIASRTFSNPAAEFGSTGFGWNGGKEARDLLVGE